MRQHNPVIRPLITLVSARALVADLGAVEKFIRDRLPREGISHSEELATVDSLILTLEHAIESAEEGGQ